MRWTLKRYVSDATGWQPRFLLERTLGQDLWEVYAGADGVPITFETIEAAVHHVRDNFKGRGYSVEWDVSYGSGA